MKESITHLVRWDLRVARRYLPLYTLDLRRWDPEPLPPTHVELSAEFDDDTAALDFERAMRELLERA